MDIVSQPSNPKQGLVVARRCIVRGGQILLNLLGVVACGIIVGDLKLKTTWQVWTWFIIMILELVISISGIGLYLIAKFCASEETWALSAAVYNMIQSHVILYAYLLGTQDIIHQYRVGNPPDKKTYAAIIGAIIGQLDAFYHFFYAFCPGPRPVCNRGVVNNSMKSKDAENINSFKETDEMSKSDMQDSSTLMEMDSIAGTVDTTTGSLSTTGSFVN